MTTTKSIFGAYVISDIIHNHLVTRTYIGYTKRESQKLFKHEMKGVL